jgi:hypothetical protein
MQIYIDTELWVFAQKSPDSSRFIVKSEYKRMLDFHVKSREFLKEQFASNTISMTTHQLCEIYHALGSRGQKMKPFELLNYCRKITSNELITWYMISNDIITQAINLSANSRIHIWDYVCVLPLYKDVEIIYSCDEHFKHNTFQSLGPKIENPLEEWMTL